MSKNDEKAQKVWEALRHNKKLEIINLLDSNGYKLPTIITREPIVTYTVAEKYNRSIKERKSRI
ncbi:hypothetical protein [Listeria booriae]|uniref:hypothetical protein n=1 Tax=Listeria booriae TaxID=1552123 RepID=UPI001625DE22|nr:hypothetical protein [Listeria booriae]MBC2305821.1 hypothetical protein [Listeria booriae]